MIGTRFEHLMSPGRIGSLELANRIVMPAMDVNLSHGGFISDADVAHFAARAGPNRGGWQRLLERRQAASRG